MALGHNMVGDLLKVIRVLISGEAIVSKVPGWVLDGELVLLDRIVVLFSNMVLV